MTSVSVKKRSVSLVAATVTTGQTRRRVRGGARLPYSNTCTRWQGERKRRSEPEEAVNAMQRMLRSEPSPDEVKAVSAMKISLRRDPPPVKPPTEEEWSMEDTAIAVGGALVVGAAVGLGLGASLVGPVLLATRYISAGVAVLAFNYAANNVKLGGS
ncbi:hypothetical protein QJQ45_013959 [Haematococcus lacustris]|nr:hypothetical protein QJQ45_013959 [Haematococcus lacustris]